jgi:serine/threonine protein kinase
MHSSDNLKDLPPREWDRLESLLNRFERTWREGDAVDLRHFLPPVGDPLRLRALKELVMSELEIRWRRGQRALLEEYLQRFPELNEKATLHPPLLAAEYQVRQRHGDKPPLEAYQQRFPEQFGPFEKLVQEARAPAPLENKRSPAPAPAAAPDKGHLPVGGGYHLIERLGRGEFGVVWRALAPGGVEVAIKIIHRPVETALAQRELEALNLIKLLRHPFLLQTQGFWTWEDKLIIAMQLADSSLGDRLKKCVDLGLSGIPVDELRIYMHEACEALDFLHSKQVLHRDIKPANILLMQGHAMLADFGVARMLQPERTVEATLVGTPLYIAPEVWRGRVDPRSDQYSLAATYFELRTNRPIFPSSAIVELMSDHTQRAPELDPLPKAEQEALLKALSKDPTRRYESCLEFFRTLDQALVGEQEHVKAAALPAGEIPPVETAPPKPTHIPVVSDTGRIAAAALRTAIDPQIRETIRSEPPPRPDWRGDKARTAPARRSLLVPALSVLVLLAGLSSVAWWVYVKGRPSVSPIPPPPKAKVDFLPHGCVPDDGAEIVSARGKKVYQRIAFVFPDGATRAEFVLIPNQGGDGEPPPFYILRTKVSNQLFQQFAKVGKLESPWAAGARMDGRDLGVADDNRQFPVVNVTWDDADAFAQWFGELLQAKMAVPSGRQWDKAAGQGETPPSGRFDDAPGPFQGNYSSSGPKCVPPAFALGGRGPLPVGGATQDHTNSGCSDMASNGFEWTSTKCDDNDKEIGPVIAKVRTHDWLSVRGATYDQTRPYVYGQRKVFKRLEHNGDGYYRRDLSFRVVIEVPDR